MMLALEGFSTQIASDGLEALRSLEAAPPDLVLLDVMLPRLDGLAVCRHIRATASLAHLPVILISAMSQPEDVRAGLDAGADAYLPKPIDSTQVLESIRELLTN